MMPPTARVQIRIDPATKAELQEWADDIGRPLNSLISNILDLAVAPYAPEPFTNEIARRLGER